MKKYIRYIAPALLALGVAMLIFGIVCACCADSGIGRVEDTYYYLGMNLYHGRFDACDTGDVLEMFDDMGISGSIISGFERFAVCVWIPFVVLGAVAAVAGGIMMFRAKSAAPGKASAIAALVWEKTKGGVLKAYAWVCKLFNGRRCPVCGEKLLKDALFCGGCGAKLDEAVEKGSCPDCGTVNESDANFCNGCGRKLKDD